MVGLQSNVCLKYCCSDVEAAFNPLCCFSHGAQNVEFCSVQKSDTSVHFDNLNKITKIKTPLCRLHMLNELEQCFLTLMDFPSTSTRGQLTAMGLSSPVGDTTMATPEPAIEFAPLMQQWGSRLKFSQVLFGLTLCCLKLFK